MSEMNKAVKQIKVLVKLQDENKELRRIIAEKEKKCIWKTVVGTFDDIWYESACGGTFHSVRRYCGDCGREVEVKP